MEYLIKKIEKYIIRIPCGTAEPLREAEPLSGAEHY
jgi:hypothetical protein